MAERSVYLKVIPIFFIQICYVLGTGVTDPPKTTSDVYCWHNSDNSQGMNQSCVTGKSHPPNMVSSTSTNETEAKVSNSTVTPVSVNPPVMRCVTYTNDTTLRFRPSIVATSLDTWRSCDFDGICNDKPLNQTISAVINGSNVSLFCCEGNNCNKPVPVSSPTPNTNKSHCYQLTMEGSNMRLKGCKAKCPAEGVPCIKDTLYLKSGIVSQMYNCDIDNRCSNITSSEPNCSNFSTGANNTREVCCCKGDYCVKPDQSFDEPIEKDANSACSVVPINSTNHHPPGGTSPQKKVDWLFVGGLIASGVVAILLALLVVIIIMKMKRRAKQNDRLTLSYTRLAADRVPDDDEDVQMLLS
ncbi:uncharacterized protein LOC132558076 [Ylistrum balloti]|uniref:uncharacterized protein LOC132558076 n=1 Tax=Ylistrum balloti TaxID=509963 RepID=UPI00290582C5|nr:uncharacterized protein LOC132558076 [Ylistrum balloti]